MAILDLIFPKKCLGCQQTGSYFCSHCLNLASLKPERICPICLRPAWGGRTHRPCRSDSSLDGLTSVFANRGVIKKATLKLKDKFITDLATDLVELFLSFCGEDKTFCQFISKEKPILIPIPLHSSKKRWRGFNQAELLGKMISQNLGLKYEPKVLKRIKKNNSQNAFELNNHYQNLIINQSLIVFDDFWQTGATLKEAGKTLKRNQAKKVWGLTLAR